MTSDFQVAVHALVFLAHKKTWLRSDDLAQNICTNPTRVRKILAQLSKAGLVKTKEGKSGGYQLMDEQTNLAQIARATHTSLLSATWQSGDVSAHCPISQHMGPVMAGLLERMEALCLTWLEGQTVEQLEKACVN